jgi:amino acid transporter
VLATVAVMLVALRIGRYARHSSSPGSLYTYASMTLPAWLSATVAWSLLLAFVATGSSVIGCFYHYANLQDHRQPQTGPDVVELHLLIPSLTRRGEGGTLRSLLFFRMRCGTPARTFGSLDTGAVFRRVPSLLLPNILVPHGRIRADILAQH